MKPTPVFFIVLLAVSIAVHGQNKVTRELADFTSVEIKNGILAELVQGEKSSVEIRTAGLEPSKVLTGVTSGRLVIDLDVSVLTKHDVTVRVFYKNLTEISGSGQAEISAGGLFKQDSLTVSLFTGAEAYLDADVKYLQCRAVEGATLTMEGYTDFLDATAGTGATLSLFDMESVQAVVKVTTSAKAKINVEENLKAEASTGGIITYMGDPMKIDSKTGIGGNVSKFEE